MDIVSKVIIKVTICNRYITDVFKTNQIESNIYNIPLLQ